MIAADLNLIIWGKKKKLNIKTEQQQEGPGFESTSQLGPFCVAYSCYPSVFIGSLLQLLLQSKGMHVRLTQF